MSYERAMELAGAKIHVYESFGSYQGDWYAKVTYKGKTGWVHGSYGSCSGCDAFQSEFDYSSHECAGSDYYNPIYNGWFRENCPKCQDLYRRLISFGENYLDDIMSYERAEELASRHLDWDMSAKEMLDFLRSHAV